MIEKSNSEQLKQKKKRHLLAQIIEKSRVDPETPTQLKVCLSAGPSSLTSLPAPTASLFPLFHKYLLLYSFKSNKRDSLPPELKELKENLRIKSHWPSYTVCTPLRSGLRQVLTPKTRPERGEAVILPGKYG